MPVGVGLGSIPHHGKHGTGIFTFFAIAILIFYIFYFLTTLINNINYNNATFVVWNRTRENKD